MALPFSIIDAGTAIAGNRLLEPAAKHIAKAIGDFTTAYKDRTAAVREQTAAIVQAARLITGADAADLKELADAATGMKGPTDAVADAIEASK